MGFGTPLYPFSYVTRGLKSAVPSSGQVGALYSAYDEPALYMANQLNTYVDMVCRNKAEARSVAGLYSCQTLLHENINPCMEEIHVQNSFSSTGTTGVVSGGGTYANLTSPARMSVKSGVTSGDNARICVPFTYPMGCNFYETSFLLHGIETGVGDGAVLFAGMKSNLSSFDIATAENYLGFYYNGADGKGYIGCDCGGYSDVRAVAPLFGREITNGDLITARFYRMEGSIDIDSYAFFINGKRIYAKRGTGLSYIPDVALYPGFGAYAMDDLTAYCELIVRSFNVKYNP